MWPTFIYSPHPGQILVESRRTGSTRRTEQGQGRSSNKVQAAGVQTADLMLLDSVAQTVSSHFMGPVWAPQLPSLVSSVINFKSRSYTCLSPSPSFSQEHLVRTKLSPNPSAVFQSGSRVFNIWQMFQYPAVPRWSVWVLRNQQANGFSPFRDTRIYARKWFVVKPVELRRIPEGDG